MQQGHAMMALRITSMDFIMAMVASSTATELAPCNSCFNPVRFPAFVGAVFDYVGTLH